MSKMAPKKLHPLRYESYENLKKHALNIDKQLSNSLKRLSNFKRLKYLLETEREARMKLQDGDEENAYILYNRALAIYRMISDAKDDTFNRSKDGRLFYDTSHRMCSDLEKVTENLQQRFRHSQENASTITKMKSLSVSRPVDTTFESYAKPVEIVRFVAQGMNALVLDYRDKQSETIEYKSPRGTMEVVHINQRDIMPGSLLPSIFKALDISFRPLLEKISHFDLVALLGDVNDTSKEKGTKTFILNEALTTYNFNYKLKRPPVIIEGGFMNWKNAYPQYINQTSDVPGFEKTFDEQFAIWIIESKKANELRIHYPCLTGFVKESAPFDDHHNPVEEAPKQQYQRSHSTTSVFSYPSEALNHSTANSASHYTNKEVTRDLPNQLDKKAAADESHQIAKKPMQIPVIDRSKKPPIVVNKSFSDQNQKRPTLKDRECRNVHYNKENCAPADGPTRSTSPFPQVLGGLGGQNGLDEINQRRRIPEGNFGNHAGPPHPRRRQAPVIPSAREELTPARPPLPPSRQEATADDGVPHYFRSSYQMSLQKMSYDSEYKQMPPGQTGLFNMGNTCFMNSTLQPLFHTPDFSELFRDNNAFRYINEKNKFGTKGIISGSFSALIDLMWSGKFSAVRPSLFLEFFAKRVNAELADRQQHDAQEFQIYLLDALHEDTNKVDTRQLFEQNYDSTNLQASAVDFFQRSNLFSSSPVNDLFNLTTISVIQCCTCNTTSVRFEAVNQISVELPNVDYLKLKDCLEAHFSTTNLEAPWDCPKCKSKESAKRSTKIWLVPKVLIIHLKRFSLNDQFFVKNEVEVTFDVNELDLSPYIHSKSPLVNATYSLYAVTNHSGRLNSGHYTSNVINLASTERNWLHFDDETCSPSSAPSPTSKQVFLLYYKLTSSQTK